MGLDQYLSVKQRVDYNQGNNERYWDVRNLFGSFSTKSEKEGEAEEVSFYISDWKHNKNRAAEESQFNGIIDLFELEGFVPESSPSGNVTFGGRYPDSYIDVDVHVAYWRKANQIHTWFVDNVQGGEDECNPFDASREQLETLVRLCKQVLGRSELQEGKVHTGTSFTTTPGGGSKTEEHYEEGKVIAEPAVAQELLPTQSGFFFGGTDYDEWYVQDLEETVRQIEHALTLPPEWTFVYQSSW